MTKKGLDQFKRRLTASQIAEGMNAALSNAKRLADAASLLLEKEFYPLAASIAALSIEESGKVPVLRSLAVAKTDDEAAKNWREYRSHTRKNAMWILPQLVAEGARRLDDFRPLFEEGAEHPFLLDQVKQIGFYTDCLGNAHWSVPTEVIDAALASILVKTALLFARPKEFTVTEIELWIKHMGPDWKGREELMVHALVRWYEEMQEVGLAERGENRVENFFLYGVGTDITPQ
jgi:AbiV family abortive infection protein